MANLKIEFQKPKLTLCNTNYTPLGILTNKTFTSAHNITLTSKVNETPYLTFDMPLGGLIDNNSTELLIKHKNDYFVIKNISIASGDSNSLSVTAEHIACELKGIVVSYFEDLIGETPENMWNTIVANSTMPDAINSRYIFETNIVDTYRYLSGEDEKSVFEHLVDIAEQFEACLLFSTDADGIIHIKLLYGDIDRGKFIRKGKDLKQLNLTFNTESLFTKVTPFGAVDDSGIELTIMDLNDGKSYLTNYDYYLAKGMTMQEILANPLCNQECIYRNTDIIDAEDLLRLGQQELKRLSEPIVNGSVEVIDLGVFEGSLYLSPILCEKIIVIDKDINYSISCKITEIEFTYDNPLESKISISNVVKYSSALKELIKTSDAVSEILTNGLNGKPNLNASKVKGLIDGHIAQLKYSMENNITDITDAVILFENRIEGSDMFGALAIGSRGILISRELDIATNQWVWTTALDSHGLSTQIVNAIEINASQIKGDRLSSYDDSTWIDLNNGEFNFKDKIKFIDNEFSISLNNGGTLDNFVAQYEKDKAQTDKELAELNNALDNVGGTIDGSFKDGIIDEVEMLNIKEALKILEKEKIDVDARYEYIYNNVSLTGSAKTNLKTRYDNFVVKYNNLVSIINTIINDGLATDEEVIQYESAFNSYNQSIPPLSTAFDVAIEIIAKNNTETQIGELKDALDADIKNANDSIANLEETMNGSFKDGLIDEAEYIAIKESLTRLETEKSDIDKNYQSLYNNANISSSAKTELKTKYDNYNKAHDFLVNYINVTIGDRVATQSEISVIKSKLTEYNTALSEYSVAQTKAINDIAENSANANLQNYKKLVDKDIQDINQKINDMTVDIGGVIADGIIDEAETLIIQNNITELNKEKADIDERYKNIYNNTNLNNTVEKTNLANKYNSYNTAHNNLINTINTIAEDKVITTSEKSDFDTAVNNYNIKLSQLSIAFDNAINKISENMANSITESLRTELQGNIDDVSNLVSNLDDYVNGAFKDGILTESEKDSIRTYLVSLNTEKKDIDQQYTTLYNNADLIGTAKTNLKTAYDTYVTKYNNLVSKINATLELTTISDSSRTSLNTAFSEHDTALATYSKRVNEAINAIADKKKEDAKSYTNTQFNILNDKIELRVTSKEVQEMVDSSISESNAYADTLFQDAKNQIDGKIESYYQTTDPSKSWTTTTLKTQHTGDIWHDSLNNITYRWSGTAWVKLTDADAEQAKTIASSKAKVFTTTPTTPYKVGDLWVQGSSGDIMRCTYARSSGNYVSSDWAKASKYTDDTTANSVKNNLANNYYTKTQTDSAITVAKESIELGVSKEVETIYESIDNIEVGGRNLVRNSAFVNGTSYWNFGTNVTLDTSRTFNGHSTIKSSQSGLTSNQYRGCKNYHLPISPNPLIANQTYTMSCYYYIENTSTFDYQLALEVKGMKSGATSDNTIGKIVISQANLVSNKWTRMVATFTPTAEYTSSYIYAWVGKNGTAWFADFKLEKGDKCTDWSSAPEDAEDYTNVVKNNLANNYYTKTQTDSAIKVSADSISSSVSSTYVTKDTFNNTTSTLATKSEVTQTKDALTAKFSQTGGINLIRNGSFWDGLNGWSNWGSPSTRNVTTTSLGYRNKLRLVTTGTNQGVNQQISDLEVGTKYILSAYVNVESGNCVIMVNNNGNYTSTVSSGTGKKWLELTFTASNTSVTIYLGRSGSGSNGTYDFTAVQLERGSTRSSWSPNANEICEGITTINEEGITVSHSNINATSKMTANGFYIEDSNGETIASLSSKEQWTELKADKVFANNIENIYEGDANLYVDHSKTEVGDGTSSKPFSCFYELRDYLEKAPIINKDLTINVVSTGTISDVLYLRGLKGRGAITININKTATFVDKTNSHNFIYLYDVRNLLTIKGGRTGYATNDGALISGYKYGVFANHCRYVRVEYIAINTKTSYGDQWGVIFNETNGMTYRVDFCDSPNAIYADRSSQIYDADSCGNGTIAFYSANGSSIMFGSSEDNGYRPSGSLVKGGGNIVDLGNRSARASFRTAPATPSTVNQYKDFEFSDYGYYSEGYSNWNSIGYKTVYQGNWQSYGNNRGIFTLPNSEISSYLSGATILDGNQITLQRENAGGYSSSQTIYLWGTTQTTASGSAPPLTKSYGALGMLAWGERKTFTLPKTFVTDLKNGTIKSVMFYTSNGSNYIKFSPVCTLRLKVNK